MNKVDGFESLTALKRTLGAAGEGKQWHHIVEQSQISKSGFATGKIQNVENVIAIPSGTNSVHSKISAYFSSVSDFTKGKTVRNWLAGKSYEEQFKLGMNYLKRFGTVEKGADGIWKFIPFN